MKNIILIICILSIFSCASYHSYAPQDLIDIKNQVDNEMAYKDVGKKYSIPPAEKGLFGETVRYGACTNYAAYYIKLAHEKGYAAKMIFLHVAVKVTLENGDVYILDSAKSQIYKIGEVK